MPPEKDAPAPKPRGRPKSGERRRAYPLRLREDVHAALERWASDELRSVNAQIEFLLRKALLESGRSNVRE
jgi:hypothetical protein